MKEKVVGGIIISSPERVLYPEMGITKFEVANYYSAVAERMLAYIKGRPLTVIRCHEEVGDKCFYKKHPTASARGVRIVELKDSDGNKSDYFCVDDVKGLLSEVQSGTVEFHARGCTADNPEKPDIMVFDLDPDENLPIERLREGAMLLKQTLDNLELRSFLKTSGGKGYHIVVPFKQSGGWESFHSFSAKIASVMENSYPTLFTANVRKINRKNKIYIDFGRNTRGATSIAPYSLRTRQGASVAMPIEWNELETIAPNAITLKNVSERLKQADPWRDFFSVKQSLK